MTTTAQASVGVEASCPVCHAPGATRGIIGSRLNGPVYVVDCPSCEKAWVEGQVGPATRSRGLQRQYLQALKDSEQREMEAERLLEAKRELDMAYAWGWRGASVQDADKRLSDGWRRLAKAERVMTE